MAELIERTPEIEAAAEAFNAQMAAERRERELKSANVPLDDQSKLRPEMKQFLAQQEQERLSKEQAEEEKRKANFAREMPAVTPEDIEKFDKAA